jgi:hypothetical protein
MPWTCQLPPGLANASFIGHIGQHTLGASPRIDGLLLSSQARTDTFSASLQHCYLDLSWLLPSEPRLFSFLVVIALSFFQVMT